MKPLRILIADDHALLREGLTVFLEAQGGFKVVGHAARGEEACALAEQLHPDVVIMDVDMPGIGGAAATKRLQDTCPGVKVLAFSGHADEIYVRQLLAAGASGYLLKSTVETQIVAAVRVVAEGGTYLDFHIAGKVTGPLERSSKANGEELSKRETHVLRLTAQGLTMKEIATLLCVTVKTAETHKTRATRKLNMHSRSEIVSYAITKGWLKDEVIPS